MRVGFLFNHRIQGFWAPLWIYSHIPYDLAVMVMAGGIYNVTFVFFCFGVR